MKSNTIFNAVKLNTHAKPILKIVLKSKLLQVEQLFFFIAEQINLIFSHWSAWFNEAEWPSTGKIDITALKLLRQQNRR